jgi:hypothetical protein
MATPMKVYSTSVESAEQRLQKAVTASMMTVTAYPMRVAISAALVKPATSANVPKGVVVAKPAVTANTALTDTVSLSALALSAPPTDPAIRVMDCAQTPVKAWNVLTGNIA